MTSDTSTDSVSAMNDSNPASSIPTIRACREAEYADASKNDQELCKFLGLLENDIASHPERLIALDPTLVARLGSLVGGIDVDLNTPLIADDE